MTNKFQQNKIMEKISIKNCTKNHPHGTDDPIQWMENQCQPKKEKCNKFNYDTQYKNFNRTSKPQK